MNAPWIRKLAEPLAILGTILTLANKVIDLIGKMNVNQ
jgi:hypothetical protein